MKSLLNLSKQQTDAKEPFHRDADHRDDQGTRAENPPNSTVQIFRATSKHVLQVQIEVWWPGTFIDMFQSLTDICDPFLPGECWNYLMAAGYVTGLRSDV
jgi:hypothetical protein